MITRERLGGAALGECQLSLSNTSPSYGGRYSIEEFNSHTVGILVREHPERLLGSSGQKIMDGGGGTVSGSEACRRPC